VNRRVFDLILIVALVTPVALFPVKLAARRWVGEDTALAPVGAAVVIGAL